MRRVLAAVIAFLMVLIGSLVLVRYVQAADTRAIANQSPTQVLVVQRPVVKGTKGRDLGASVALMQVPGYATAEGAVSSVDMIKDLVASTDLVPGEQVLQGRFVKEEDLTTKQVKVPRGMVTVSMLLDSDRAHAGVIEPGDYLGLITSTVVKKAVTEDGEFLPPEAVDNPTPGAVVTEKPGSGPWTHTIINKALVVRVEGAVLPVEKPEVKEGDTATATEETEVQRTAVIITLAVTYADAEKIVWSIAQEGAATNLWTVLVNDDTTIEGIRIVNRENIFQ